MSEENHLSDHKYLDRLEFKPELKNTWLNFFVSKFRVVLLLIFLVSVWGIYSLDKLPRESNPEVKIPIAVIITGYPGASPSDVEELVTKKVEARISGIKGIDQIRSVSANSLSSVTVEFDPKQDLEDSIQKIKDKVSNIGNELPQEASDPEVREISFDDSPVLTIALSGPYDGFTMYDFAEDIKEEIEKTDSVREVNIYGGDIKEIEISYDPKKLIFYGLTADSVNQILKATNVNIPSGNFEGSQFVYPVRADGRFFTAAQLNRTVVGYSAAGVAVLLSDVASVSEQAAEKTAYSRVSSSGETPKEVVSLDILKRSGGNIIETAEKAKEAALSYTESIPGLKATVIMDESKWVKQDFERLNHDFILTLFLVMGVLLMLIGLKEAFVAGIAIPLVFFVTFGVMDLTGITLNFLSTFSLLLSLGLIVDDAIVVVSATKQYMRTGKYTPEEAVLLVLNDFKIVLTSTTLTTVWAFLPLLFSTGIMGEFLKSVPITISVTLIASLLIALMVNHPLAAILERVRLTKNFFFVYVFSLVFLAAVLFLQNGLFFVLASLAILALATYMIWWYEKGAKEKLAENRRLMAEEYKNADLIKKKLRDEIGPRKKTAMDWLLGGMINLNVVLPLYEKHLSALIDRSKTRKIFLMFVFGLFAVSASLPALGIVKTEFFPADDFDFMYINIEAPIGSKLEETDKIVRLVEDRLLKYPEIDNFSTVVGSTIAGTGFSSGRIYTDKASITINLTEKDLRNRKSFDLEKVLRDDLAEIKNANITVSAPRGGPPSGSAFEARITGDELSVLEKIAHDLEPLLKEIEGVVDTEISLKETSPEYTFTLNQQKLAENGLSPAYVGSILRTAISGSEITSILRENKEIKVIARFSEESIPDLVNVQNLQILNLRGEPVYLRDVAKTELKSSVEQITRIDQKRTILLSGGVEAKTRPNQVVEEFQNKIKDYQLPEGYQIEYGGQNEQNEESVLSILKAMLVAGLLIVSTLIIQFNSLLKTLIVLITVPLALIGVFLGMAIFGITLSFPGLIGILALFGIVVKNAIILIDKINLNLKSGIPYRDSIIDAAKSRFEAIFITSFCTIIGIIPITLSSTTWMALGTAIIFGLSVSSFFTLFVIPCLFVLLIPNRI